METIYLVLIANTKEICFGSFDQYTAQQKCHKAAKLAKTPCEVKRENFYSLPVEVRDELIRTSKEIRQHVGKIHNVGTL